MFKHSGVSVTCSFVCVKANRGGRGMRGLDEGLDRRGVFSQPHGIGKYCVGSVEDCGRDW